jgi:signal transduction histidine kinase
MKLTHRLFLFFFVTLISTGGSIYLLSHQIFLEGFAEIEDVSTRDNLQRIANFMNEEINNLHSAAQTWSAWDETYRFMQTRRQSYLKNNYEVSSFFESNFGQVYIVDLNGKILYSKSYLKGPKIFSPIEPSQLDLVEHRLIPFIRTHGPYQKGIFIGGSKPFFISVSPILPGSTEGPSQGFFIVLRGLGDDIINKFNHILKLDMELSIGNADEWSEEVSKDGAVLTGPHSLQGVIALPGILGANKLIVRLNTPRTIYNQGQKTIISFLMIVSFFLTIAFGFVFFGFHKDVLSKILKLKSELNEIGSQPYQSERLHWSGKDEIAELAQNINAMLIRLENSQVMASRTSKFSALGEMAGSIAHEINNPLAIIIGFCSRILRAVGNEPIDREEIKEASNRILKTAYRIERIIKSLRLVSRDGERDSKTEVMLGDILDEVISLSENKLQESNIELRLENFDFNQKVRVRFVQIVQVFLNLLSNSLDAISEQKEKWIEIRTKLEDKVVHIDFIDSGEGISAEIADKIMDPFFTTKELGQGTGLGLSISKGIVESHQGQFMLLKEAKHTCFRMTLPL